MTPVLWLYGPAGVGKTTAGWRLFTSLDQPVGYVDIDQLGMYYPPPTSRDPTPEPPYDPGRHRMKARNLDAVVANFRATGARGVVVSGVVDTVLGTALEPLPHAALTALRLRADGLTLRHRIIGRDRSADRLHLTLADAAALEKMPDPVVDTTDLAPDEVVRLIRQRIGDWPGPAPADGPFSISRRPGEILWLCGPAGIGKSAVGWHVYLRLRGTGRRTAYVDLDQIGFRRPVQAGNHRLKAANLAALWETYAADGARHLVVAGPVTPAAVALYTAALPAAACTLIRLRATPATLAERVRARGRGESPAPGLAGDPLKGQPDAELDRIAAQSAREAAELERADVGDVVLDTDGRDPAALAESILATVAG